MGATVASLFLAAAVASAEENLSQQWHLPEAREVALGRRLGEACDRGVKRLGLPPYDSAEFFQQFDGLPIDHSHGNLVRSPPVQLRCGAPLADAAAVQRQREHRATRRRQEAHDPGPMKLDAKRIHT